MSVPMPDASPLRWDIASLVQAFRVGSLSPVEVAREALERIERLDPVLHAFVSVEPEFTLTQALAAERSYRDGAEAPLLGVPISIKDAFYVSGMVTTLGSRVHGKVRAVSDSGVVSRLRAAGAVFTGKTNMAEFGQSATTDNLLGPATRNPWDLERTPGGSSGGAAASVAAGLSTAAIGSDGGGSIRIPASFTGLFGVKPTHGFCPDENGFRAMTDFVSPGPLTARVADARALLRVLSERILPAGDMTGRRMRVGWCPRPEGRPVDGGVAQLTADAVVAVEALGHELIEIDLPIEGWAGIFGPLVLAEEHRERGHLLDFAPDELTAYERTTLEAARRLRATDVERAAGALADFRARVASIFSVVDVIATPAVAVTAFPLGERPVMINDEPVDSLWGAFPFAAPFNVAGNPAASLPCGTFESLPVGLQLITAVGEDALLLDFAEQLESEFAFDRSSLAERWDDVGDRLPLQRQVRP